MAPVTESTIEDALLEQLAQLGYVVLDNSKAGPDGSNPERGAYSDIILLQRLEDAIQRLNPHIPSDARQDALKMIIADEKPSLVDENRRLHKHLVEGVNVEFYDKDGTIRGDRVRLLDFDDPAKNDWVAFKQYTVVENKYNRRPDVVVFVNGLPLGIIELKNPSSKDVNLTSAYNQLQTYKKQIPSLFRTNALMVISDGLTARFGSLTANVDRFMPWRSVTGTGIKGIGSPEMPILIEGMFERSRFLKLIRDFTMFGDDGSGIVKIIAGYHQFHAVERAVKTTVNATAPNGDKKIGVIWHTQGSGKSMLMAFYTGQLVRLPELENPTIVVITDRNDLDDQLFRVFSMCHDLIGQIPTHAESRNNLQKKLHRDAGGVIFTTIQKFYPEQNEASYPVLTNRRNVIVIVDEAHRSQYGFKAQIGQETGKIAYGFAKHLRDALPNASFIGFTGTPIEEEDVNTPAVFGEYIDVYDISRAVKDGATVPIYYESRLARIELPEDAKPKIDREFEDLMENVAITKHEMLKVEALIGAESRLKLVASDLVPHFKARIKAMSGKAMVVCTSRRICIALYNEITALQPDWHSDEDTEGEIKVVMTGDASDPEEWQVHIRNQARRSLLAKRIKDPEDKLKLVIVQNMWLTGFDAPSLHTMYVDKHMKGHGLMQAIARVNRVFRDKPAGLVVDYIGIAQNLKSALHQYSHDDQQNVGIDKSKAVASMMEKYDVVRAMYHGFNYTHELAGTPHQRLALMAEAIEWVLAKQHQAAMKEVTADGKMKAHRRYQDAVLSLSKAYALAAASDEARQIQDEVAFFQAIRTALAKSSGDPEVSHTCRLLAVKQIIDRSVVSSEIVDILKVAGLSTPDISILSDEFLSEVQKIDKKHLVLEALKKLLGDEIRSRSRSNVVETRKFSERLEQAIAKYHTNAISTVEVLQELIDLAHEIRAARRRGEEEGLSQDEIAFYDALAENESAIAMMGNDELKVIAFELLTKLKSNISVDWAHRESARARMRMLVKRILRKRGYPPDLQNSAVQRVLQQAEAFASDWAS